MDCNKLQLTLVIAGIIHMLIEWRLGKRAAINGGPGSLIALLLTLVSMVVTVVIRLKNNKGDKK